MLEVRVSQAFRCLRSPGGRSAVVGICSELSCPRGKFFFLLFIFIHICFYSLIIGVLYDPHVEFYGACFHHSPEELRLINLPRRVPSEFPRSSLPLVAPPGVPLGPRRLRENASPGLTWATHLSIVSPTVKLELNFPS